MSESKKRVAKKVARSASPKPAGKALVSALALSRHFFCEPSYIARLRDQQVIQKTGDGYDVDACRKAYLEHLRSVRKASPRTLADSAFTAAKAELIQIRVSEKKRELVKQTDVDAFVDNLMGVLLTALSSLPAQCAPLGDLPTRRRIEAAIFKLRSDLAVVAQRKADAAGEPPFGEPKTDESEDAA